jgi:hypothetical protein
MALILFFNVRRSSGNVPQTLGCLLKLPPEYANQHIHVCVALRYNLTQQFPGDTTTAGYISTKVPLYPISALKQRHEGRTKCIREYCKPCRDVIAQLHSHLTL